MTRRGILSVLAVSAAAVAVYGVLLGLLLYFERGADTANVRTFGEALWWSVVTLTTVGYGDYSPVTVGGRVISVVFLIGSVGLIGFLIGRLTSFLTTLQENKRLGYKGCRFTSHIVILGWDPFAQSVTNQLVRADIPVAVVTSDRSVVDLIRENYSRRDVYVLLSDFTSMEMMAKANINHSAMVFINLPDDSAKLVQLLNCRRYYDDSVPYAVIPENPELHDTYEAGGAALVLSKNDIASQIIASYIFEPEVAAYTEDLMTSAGVGTDYDFQEYRVEDDNPHIGDAYNDLYFTVKERYDAILIGLARTEDGKRTLYKNPDDPALTVAKGDYLIFILSGKSAERIKTAFKTTEGYLLRELS
jgi:voltage-gated potassium channel